jgi:hypothetical protein
MDPIARATWIGDERIVRGVVLYTGGERLPFGERLEAWPLSTLWTDAPT